MPIYEYQCAHCGHCFELKQGFEEPPVAVCPRCQGQARRTLHSVPVIFKGSGFYITDNRKEKEEKAEAKAETKAEAKAETKAEAKEK